MSYFRQFLNSTFSRNQVLFLFSLIFADLAILYLARSTIGIHALFFLLTIPVMGAGWLFGPYAGGISGFLTALTGALLAISWKLTTWERALTAWPLMFLFILIGYTVGLIKLQRQQRQTLTNYLGRCKKLADLLSTLGPKWLETTVAEERYSYLTEQLRDFLGAKSVHLLTSDKQGTIQVLASSGSMNPPPSLLAKQILITNDIFEQFPSNNHMVILAPEMPAKMVPLSDLEDVEVPAEGELVVPLLMAGSLLGVLVIHFEQSLPLAQEHKIGIQWTGWQALLLLWGSQQEKHFLKQLQQSQALARIAQTLNLTETVGLEPLLQLVVDSAHQLIPNSQNVVLHLIEQDRHILIPKAVSGKRKLVKTRLNMQLGKGIAGRAISEGKTIYVPDIRNEQHFIPPSTSVTYRSLLVVPIKKSNREVIGTLSVESDLPFAFTAEDISLLETLSFHAAIAIENTRLLETTRQDLQELCALYQISRMLASTLNPQELFYETVHLLNQLFGFYHTQIFLVDHTRRALVICAASGEHAKALLEQEYAIEFGSGIVGHVAEIGEAFFTNDVDAVIFHVRHPLLEETQSELAIPIKVNNQVWGVLDIQEKPPRQIHKHQMDLLHAVADQLSVALEKAQLYQDLQNALRQERETRMQLLQSERLALAGRLLASISHELNNPIQAIQNALFLLRQEEKLSPQ
ncbi:MAG: GAF domain-containing protein, partial [Anaerolineales bacterium]|nr:GAF domain-containing protein [Anaerolineales bacterium]